MNTQDTPPVYIMKPRHAFWLPLLTAGVLASIGATLYEGRQTSELKQRFTASQQDNAEWRAKLAGADSELRRALDSVRSDLAQARAETSAGLTRAESTVSRHAEAVATRLARKQDERARLIADELTRVKTINQETAAKLDDRIEGITTQVGTVKTYVDMAKTDIQDTRSELQCARGDMGAMSGLIATNSKEIQFIRDLGDRNIFEFNVAKSAGMQQVGDIQLILRKVDPRHNRYSLELLADDKRVEKKDRGVNEPVQFYRDGARQPCELVVNHVDKDRIVGYLATPKLNIARQ